MPIWLWSLFVLTLVGLLAYDLGVTRKKNTRITASEGLLSTLIWIAIAVGVGVAISIAYRDQHLDLAGALQEVGDFARPATARDAALQFVTAYAVEIALSLDNVAVLALLFAHFRVRTVDRQRVLFWAILFSLFTRGGIIAIFAQALHLTWMAYLFGILIAIAMLRTLLLPDENTDFDRRWLIRWIRNLPWTPRPAGELDEDADAQPAPSTPPTRRTRGLPSRQLPLMAVALAAAAADISFATDSIPAVFSVTRDPLIAITSNLLAILALRSLFFAFQNALTWFRYLKLATVLILLGLSIKTFMVASNHQHAFGYHSTAITLGGVIAIVGLAVFASHRRYRRKLALQEATTEIAASEAIAMPFSRPLPIEDLTEATLATRRNLKKIVILIVGTIIVIVGILSAPLPGPGAVIIVPIGLALLATEFVWARKILGRFKALQNQADTLSRRSPLWLVPLVIVAFWTIALAVLYLLIPSPWFQENIAKAKPLAGLVPAAGAFLPVAYWAFKVIQGSRKAHKGATTKNDNPPPRARG